MARTGAFLGTPSYVSPEQAEGVSSLDYRTDIWSLGVVAFECLVGRPPFVGQSFGSLVLAICSQPLPVPSDFGVVPPGFDAWFARSCARAPEQRFQSARDAASELRRLMDLDGAEAIGSERASQALPPTIDSTGSSPAAVPGSARGSTPRAAPFITTGVASSSGIARRREWPRGTRVIVAAGAGVTALSLLVRAFSGSAERMFESQAPAPTEKVIQAVAAQPGATRPPTELARETTPPNSETAGAPAPTPTRSSPIIAPVLPAPAAVEAMRLRNAAAVRAPTRRRQASNNAAPPQSATEGRALSNPAPGAAKPSSINLGLGPPEPVNCVPPWFVDQKGIRRLKPQCL